MTHNRKKDIIKPAAGSSFPVNVTTSLYTVHWYEEISNIIIVLSYAPPVLNYPEIDYE